MRKDSQEAVTVSLVDPDGRADDLARALVSGGIESVESVQDVAATDGTTDVLVVPDVPAADGVPALDGVELVETAVERLDVPVVLYVDSGGYDSADYGRLAQGLDAGAADVISVPLKRERLLAERIRRVAGAGGHFQSSSEQLRSLLRNYPHTLFIKDRFGRFVNVTTHTAGNYGCTRQQLIGMTDYEILDTDLADALYDQEQEIIETGKSMLNNVEGYVDQTGTKRWSSTTKVPRHDEDGNIIGIVGGTRDVTAAKRQEEMMAALHEASRELSHVTTQREIASVTGDIAEDLSLFTGVEIVLADDDDLGLVSEPVSGAERSMFDRYGDSFEVAFEAGETQYVDGEGFVTDDQSAVVESVFAGQPLDEEVGMIIPLGAHGVLGLEIDDAVFDDFTNRLAHVLAANVTAALKQAERERQLARKNRQLEEFATIGAHELRNRLQIALAAIIQERTERESDRLAGAEQTLERMDRLLTQLLRLARTGQIPRTKETVDLQRAVSRAWEGVTSDHVSLEGPESRIVSANPDSLTELFEFLFRNAAEHAGRNVTVSVGVLPDASGFFVEDDGVGISEDLQDELFDVSYAGPADNTGYGLYIVSAIVEAHDWEIEVGDSEAGGARFEITGVDWA